MVNIQLYNNSCLEVMQQLIEKGVKVDAVITDPPYGMTACKWDFSIELNSRGKDYIILQKNILQLFYFLFSHLRLNLFQVVLIILSINLFGRKMFPLD